MKYKKHIISIMVILIMMVFALSTSYSIHGELTVINNTENILGIKVVRRMEHPDDGKFTEEFIMQPCQNTKLKTFDGRNTFANSGLGIISFIIYNENNEIIKEYGEIHYENISELNYYLERRENRTYYYNFNITDELLENNASIIHIKTME